MNKVHGGEPDAMKAPLLDDAGEDV
jgi:hypothetical protein